MSKTRKLLDPDGDPIVAIEYYDGMPHAVFSSSNGGRNCTTWDFDWCPMDGVLVYHQSGFGGSPYSGPLVRDVPGPPPAAIWLSGRVRMRNACGRKRKRPIIRRWGNQNSWVDWYRSSMRPVGERELRRWGFRLLDGPIQIFGQIQNPFSAGIEGGAEYCSVCKCPRHNGSYDRYCDHVYHCEECGSVTGPGCSDACSCAPLGTAEGDTCNRDGCKGIIAITREDCYCSTTKPPCGACENAGLECPECGEVIE